MPYEDEIFLARDINATSFADQNASNVAKYRKSNISIAQNVTLTNNGTLTIGGQLGGDGSPNLQGITCSYYSQITMNSAFQIISYGNINVYGYIKQSSKDIDNAVVEMKSGSSSQTPMVIYDFKGGSFTQKMITTKWIVNVTGGVFPMSEFDFPNIQCWTKVDYGAEYNALVDLYANSEHNNMECEIFGTSNGLFQISSGYVLMKHQPKSWSGNESYTTDSRQQGTTKIKFYGDCSLNSLTITVKVSVFSFKIDSSKFFLPLSYKFDIEVCSGSRLTLGYDVKIMTGARITIDEGGTAIINSSVSTYTSFTDAAKTNPRYPSLSAAEFIVNGTLTLASNKSYGGIIKTGKTGTQLKTGSNVSVTTLEMSGENRVNHSESLQGYNSSGSLFTFSTNKTYTSKLSSDGAFYYWG